MRLGFNRQTNNRIWELHGLQNDGSILGTEGIPCFDVFETYGSTDVTGFNEVNGLAIVGMHLEETRNTLLFHDNTFVWLVADLQYIGTRIQATAVNTEEYQASNEGIRGHFESQCRKRSIYGWLAGFFGIGFGIGPGHRFLIGGRWQEGADSIQHGLNPFVLEG